MSAPKENHVNYANTNRNMNAKSDAAERSKRYLHSVSDLCSKDEMEELLDEIKHLEPLNLHTEDIQDFEIDGSRQLVNGNHDSGTAGVPSMMSVLSWDSHAVYRAEMITDACPDPVFDGVAVFCTKEPLLSRMGILRILLSIFAAVSFACVLATPWSPNPWASLPFADRIRFVLFMTIFTILVTIALLFAEVTQLYPLLPISWNTIHSLLYLGVAVGLVTGASMLVDALQEYTVENKLSQRTYDFMFSALAFCFTSGFLALFISLCTCRLQPWPEPPEDEESVDEHELGPFLRNAPMPFPILPNPMPMPSSNTSLNTDRNRAPRGKRESLPLRPLVRNSVSWDDGRGPNMVSTYQARLQQQGLYAA